MRLIMGRQGSMNITRPKPHGLANRRASLPALSSSVARQPHPRGFSFFRFRRACISPPLFGFVSATFCEAIELCRNVSALVELDWLSGVVSDANQLAAQMHVSG
jgi:hypothetical protein